MSYRSKKRCHIIENLLTLLAGDRTEEHWPAVFFARNSLRLVGTATPPRANIPLCGQLNWAEYRRLKNRVNHSIEACKENYYHSYFEDNVGKAKATWNKFNILLSRKKNFAEPSKLVIGDTEITDPYELSNAFNGRLQTKASS